MRVNARDQQVLNAVCKQEYMPMETHVERWGRRYVCRTTTVPGALHPRVFLSVPVFVRLFRLSLSSSLPMTIRAVCLFVCCCCSYSPSTKTHTYILPCVYDIASFGQDGQMVSLHNYNCIIRVQEYICITSGYANMPHWIMLCPTRWPPQ